MSPMTGPFATASWAFVTCMMIDEEFCLDFASVEYGEVLEPKVTDSIIARVVEEEVHDLGLSMDQCVGQVRGMTARPL